MTEKQWYDWIDSLKKLPKSDLKSAFYTERQPSGPLNHYQLRYLEAILWPIENIKHDGNCSCGARHYIVEKYETGIESYRCLGCDLVIYSDNAEFLNKEEECFVQVNG